MARGIATQPDQSRRGQNSGGRQPSGLHTIRSSTSRIIIMRTNLAIALTFLALLAAAPLLAACHTTAGAGQDISATGHVLTHSAEKATP